MRLDFELQIFLVSFNVVTNKNFIWAKDNIIIMCNE